MVSIKRIDIDGDNNPDVIEISENYSVPNVYFSRSITPEKIVELFNIINTNNRIDGNIAIKVHSGEPENKNFINPDLYSDLIDKVHGTIVESNTAYSGKKNTTEEHIKAMKQHGLDKYSIDILDSEDQISLSVNKPIVISENYVGSHIENYNSMIVLSHFKGHAMCGYGGALKNISIGLASSNGKKHIHRIAPDQMITADIKCDQNEFIDAMADAASSILDYFNGKMVFINIMKNISVDCDSHTKKPCMDDIGLLASTNPVALDKACLDIIYNWGLKGSGNIIERIESKHGRRIIHSMEDHGYKSIYNMINLDITEKILTKRLSSTGSVIETSKPIPIPVEKGMNFSVNNIEDNTNREEDSIDDFLTDGDE